MATHPDLTERIESVVASLGFGFPTAARRGRRAEWPYVPIIDHGHRTEQIRGVAYATRSEAIDCAKRVIMARQEALRRNLNDPRYRALREQHGLPRELGATV